MAVQLYNGDCLEVMDKLIAEGVKVDAVITDPPYELETHGGGNRKQWANIHNRFIDSISDGFDYDLVFSKFLRVCKVPNIIVFCSNKQISKIMAWFENKKLSTTLLVWHKQNYCPFGNGKHISDVEFMVFVRGKGAYWNNDYENKSKVYTDDWRIGSKLHPAQKSEQIIEHIVKLHTKQNDTVLDAFMGSGTTGVVCKRLNRNFIGIELDKNYFEIAKKRIENVQGGLF